MVLTSCAIVLAWLCMALSTTKSPFGKQTMTCGHLMKCLLGICNTRLCTVHSTYSICYFINCDSLIEAKTDGIIQVETVVKCDLIPQLGSQWSHTWLCCTEVKPEHMVANSGL